MKTRRDVLVSAAAALPAVALDVQSALPERRKDSFDPAEPIVLKLIRRWDREGEFLLAVDCWQDENGERWEVDLVVLARMLLELAVSNKDTIYESDQKRIVGLAERLGGAA